MIAFIISTFPGSGNTFSARYFLSRLLLGKASLPNSLIISSFTRESFCRISLAISSAKITEKPFSFIAAEKTDFPEPIPPVMPTFIFFTIGTLLSVTYFSYFTNNGYLDLTGVFHFVFNFGCNIMREFFCNDIIYLVLFDNDSNFPTSLNGISFSNTLKGLGKSFKSFESFYITFERFPSCTWAGTADRVGSLHQRRDRAFHFNIFMVGADGVDYNRMLLEFFGKFITDQGMGTFDAFIDCFTYIVKKTGTFCKIGIQSKFGSHNAGKVCNFNTMLE